MKVDTMNRKINTICFIFLFFFLICAVSATDGENETLRISQQDVDDDTEIYTATEETKLEASTIEPEPLKLSKEDPVLSSKATTTKEKVTLKAPNVTMYYKDGHKFTVTLNQKKKAISNAKIKITINGTSYTRVTDKNGVASLNLNLKSGTYKVVTTFEGTKQYDKQTTKSTIKVKSTIKCSDFTKYYKNTAAYYATFYDKQGKLLKNTAIVLNLNSKKYSLKTSKNGIVKLKIDLKPGKYSIKLNNPKTSESLSRYITIKSLIETKDLTMNLDDGSKFNVKILNSYGKASPNKKITLKVNGKTFTKKTDKNGMATLPIDFGVGKYKIITEFEDLKNTNQITVNRLVKKTEFSHSTLIPNYVNVTTTYVYPYSGYSLKTGLNGIIKMPKKEVFTIQVASKSYSFTTSKISGIESVNLENKYYLIPFNGGAITSSVNKNNLKGYGILISKNNDYTEIEFRSTTQDNIEMFGMYLSKGLDGRETLTYLQNEKEIAKINFYTTGFDETGLKYSLAKYYKKTNTDFNYNEITNHAKDPVRFTTTGTPVTYSYFTNYIVGNIPQENIMTKFKVNGKEELEKQETISYGNSKKYRTAMGFEVLQSYTIINERVTKDTLENWVSKSSQYLNHFGVMNLYGMHLASLETCWLADELSDNYAKEFNVEWKRTNTATILGGINLEKTYLHILNADMGMNVKANNESHAKIFKVMNSINLPKIEQYCLKNVAERYMDSISCSLDNIMKSIAANSFSFIKMGEMAYVMSEDGMNSTIALNTTSGVASVLVVENCFAYKGATIKTTYDCCGVGIMPQDIIKGIRSSVTEFNKNLDTFLNNLFKNSHPIITSGISGATAFLSLAGKIATGPMITLSLIVAPMLSVQAITNKLKNEIAPKKDWHFIYDHFTFARGGYMQSKKVYNIPNKQGSYDYIEVSINKDHSLNRDDALYISDGKTRKLTREETYQYFDDEYWSPFSVPTKYWDDSWKGVAK